MSGDYTYDDEGISLHDSDRGANTAQALNGYTGYIELKSPWPGLNPDPNVTRAKPEEMRTVAKQLQDLSRALKDSVAPGDVTSRSLEARFGPEEWGAAQYLSQANKEAATNVVAGVDLIAANLDAASKAIGAAADRYDDADSGNRSGFDNA